MTRTKSKVSKTSHKKTKRVNKSNLTVRESRIRSWLKKNGIRVRRQVPTVMAVTLEQAMRDILYTSIDMAERKKHKNEDNEEESNIQITPEIVDLAIQGMNDYATLVNVQSVITPTV